MVKLRIMYDENLFKSSLTIMMDKWVNVLNCAGFADYLKKLMGFYWGK